MTKKERIARYGRGPEAFKRDRMMERTRAAVCYLNTTREGGDGPAAVHAFMAIFHPEVSQEAVRDMARAKRG